MDDYCLIGLMQSRQLTAVNTKENMSHAGKARKQPGCSGGWKCVDATEQQKTVYVRQASGLLTLLHMRCAALRCCRR